MAHNLSRKQLEVFTTLQRMANERHYMPSVRELGAELSLSAATIQQHLTALKNKGYLTSDGTAHGLRLLRSDTSPLTRRSPLVEELERMEEPEMEERGLSIPIVGKIAAGKPIEAVETIDHQLTVGASMARSGDYLLQVQGESMIEDGIFDGDLVLIRPQTAVENGQIGVGLLADGTATLKRIYREGGRIRLQPANHTMAPIYVTNLNIQGRVVGLLRTY